MRHEFEVHYPRPRFLRLYAAPLDGEATGSSGVALILHDATEARQKTFEAIESERVQALTLLAASVAHEIGNPLNALHIHLQLMEREVKKLKGDEWRVTEWQDDATPWPCFFMGARSYCLTFFIFWESATAAAAFLMMYRKNAFSLNATLKFLVMVIIASAFVLFGMSIIYGLTGSLNYRTIREALSASTFVGSDRTCLLSPSCSLQLATLLKRQSCLSTSGYQMHIQQLFQAPSAAFLSALVDQGSYYILIRILLYIIIPTGPNQVAWTFMLAILAAVTMVVGNVFALIQNNIKRLIAYI